MPNYTRTEFAVLVPLASSHFAQSIDRGSGIVCSLEAWDEASDKLKQAAAAGEPWKRAGADLGGMPAAFAETFGAKPMDVELEGGVLMVDFEGGRFGGMPYGERVMHAAGRQATRYPTVARVGVTRPGEFVKVGTFNLTTHHLLLDQAACADLERWGVDAESVKLYSRYGVSVLDVARF